MSVQRLATLFLCGKARQKQPVKLDLEQNLSQAEVSNHWIGQQSDFALFQSFSLKMAALKGRKITGYQPVSEVSLASQEV